MRGSIAIWGLAGVIVVIIVGVLIFRSTAPDGDITGIDVEGEAAIMEEPRNGSGQLLRMKPDEPVEDGAEAIDEKDGDATETSEPVADEVVSIDAPIAFETVEIMDTGFVPSEITVAAGTQVTFVNNGQALHWPASDNHPTHKLLPGFDAKKGLVTGGEYAYTFTQVGEWQYHDHLMPTLTGTIVVSE